MVLEPGRYIHIHTQYGQGIDLKGTICRIINVTGECPDGVHEEHIYGLTSKAKNTMVVRVENILGNQCEVDVGDYCRLRKWYTWTWEEAMIPAEKVYSSLYKV